MQEIVAGHTYLLDCLKSDTQIEFKFYMDPEIHGKAQEGPSCQEVLRMLIARVKSLDIECPSHYNKATIRYLRFALSSFEERALHRAIEKHDFPIEDMTVLKRGHIFP